MSPRFQSIVVVLLFLLVASQSHAQGRRGRGRPPLSFGLITLPEVQEELGLSSEQSRLLEALQADITSQRSSRNSASREERNAVIAKLWNVLLEENQAKRFGEIRFQFEGLYVIDRDNRADFMKDMDLTEEQLRAIRQLRGDRNPIELITALDGLLEVAQLKKWERKLGPVFEFSDDTLAFRNQYLPESQRRRDRGFRSRGRPRSEQEPDSEPPNRSER